MATCTAINDEGDNCFFICNNHMGFFFSNFMMPMFIHPSIFVGFNLLEPNVQSWSFFEVFKKNLLTMEAVKHLYSEIKVCDKHPQKNIRRQSSTLTH